jgi:hypothetical protein
MGMHCIKCGCQLSSDTKEPLCGFCRNDIAKEVITENPTWALKVALEAIAEALSDLQIDVNAIKELQKEIIEAIKHQ